MNDDLGELEFYTNRIRELQNELREREALPGVRVTPDNIHVAVAALLEGLRRSGNEALARKYGAAFNRSQASEAVVRANISAGKVDEVARETMNGDAEDFERIWADVIAWLDGLSPKGSA